jgi:hypothetical protein
MMKKTLFMAASIYGITYFAFIGYVSAKTEIETIDSGKKNVAQLGNENPQSNVENPNSNNELTSLPSYEKIENPEKEKTLEIEGQTEEEDQIKKEEEFIKYCEGAPDDPECD